MLCCRGRRSGSGQIILIKAQAASFFVYQFRENQVSQWRELNSPSCQYVYHRLRLWSRPINKFVLAWRVFKRPALPGPHSSPLINLKNLRPVTSPLPLRPLSRPLCHQGRGAGHRRARTQARQPLRTSWIETCEGLVSLGVTGIRGRSVSAVTGFCGSRREAKSKCFLRMSRGMPPVASSSSIFCHCHLLPRLHWCCRSRVRGSNSLRRAFVTLCVHVLHFCVRVTERKKKVTSEWEKWRNLCV